MAAFRTTDDRAAALRLLSRDAFTSLVTLKMLTLYPEACRTTTFTDRENWACLAELDLRASHWDRRAYPLHRAVVSLEGDSEALLEAAFDRAPRQGAVFKVHHASVRARVASLPGVTHVQTYLSYAAPAGYVPSGRPPQGVSEHAEPTEEALALFARTGHGTEEVAERFRRGATWFGAQVGGRYVSACLVFPNYGRIWEIGGVFTVPEFRRMGYARAVVQAAIDALCRTGRTPRYQFREDNVSSRAVAESLGLRHAFSTCHYVTPPAP